MTFKHMETSSPDSGIAYIQARAHRPAGHRSATSLRVIAALALALIGGVAQAQNYPNKPVKIIVPYPPGGAVDVLARLLSNKFTASLGQPVIVDNRPGAGGNLGVDLVAKSPPDGYTILINTNGTAISPALYPKLPFDVTRDLMPVSQLVSTTLVIVASPKLPVGSIAEMIAAAKAKPGTLNYGMTGLGNPLHLTMEMLKLSAGIDIVSVAYKGDAQLVAALTAGEVDLAVTPTVSSLPLIEDGRIKPLAVTSAKRSAALPNLPTVAESGIPGFESTGWLGLFLPARTPAAIAAVIQSETKKALAAPDVLERLRVIAYEPVGSSSDEFAKFFTAELAKFAKLVKDANIPMQE
jgi:tripartite-type tricarboxylate transporter receptor subunit TctC